MCRSKPKGSSLPSTAPTESYFYHFLHLITIYPLIKNVISSHFTVVLSISWLLSFVIISFIFLGIPLNLKTHTKQRPWKPTAWSHHQNHSLHAQVTQGGMKFIDDLRGVPGKTNFMALFFSGKSLKKTIPKCSMYGIFTYIWHMGMVCKSWDP